MSTDPKALPLTYTCECCGETHESDWTDEDALAESAALFGPRSLEDCAIVCDDCFQRLTRRGVA